MKQRATRTVQRTPAILFMDPGSRELPKLLEDAGLQVDVNITRRGPPFLRIGEKRAEGTEEIRRMIEAIKVEEKKVGSA